MRVTPAGASTRVRAACSDVRRISSWAGLLVDLISFTFDDGTFKVRRRSAACLAPLCPARRRSLPAQRVPLAVWRAAGLTTGHGRALGSRAENQA